MKNITIPKRASLLDNLAQATAKKRKQVLDYEAGLAEEKVWENFQLTKGLKRKFVELCDKNSINKSDYLRKCILALVKSKGDASKIIGKLCQNDTEEKEEAK